MSKKAKGRPKSSAPTQPSTEIDPPFYYTLFNKDEISTEKWNDAASKSKDKGVWPFSDPSGDTILPQSMAEHVRGYTRVSEMEHVTSVVDSNRFQLEDVVTKLTDAEKLYLRQKKLKLAPRKQEAWVSLTAANEHLMSSALFRDIISVLSFFQRPQTAEGPHAHRPWTLVYPQDPQGIPTPNPGGKHAVKLFWQGAWRKVVIDDVVPVNEQGVPLLVRSGISTESWPLLVSKALLKLCCPSFRPRCESHEAVDVDIFQMLTGWAGIALDPSSPTKMLEKLYMLTPPPPSAYELVEDVPPVEDADRVTTPTDEKKSRRKSRTGTAPALARPPSASRQASAKGSTRGSLVSNVPASASGTSLPESKALFVSARLKARSPYAHSEHCLHPVRIVGCVPVTPSIKPSVSVDPADIEDWLVLLHSPITTWYGPLGWQQDATWTPTLEAALSTSRERVAADMSEMMAAEEQKMGHAFFSWHVRLTDFVEHFEAPRVFHKPYVMPNLVLWQQIGTSAVPVVGMANEDGDLEFKEANVLDANAQCPWYIVADSKQQIELVFAAGVAPPSLPYDAVRISTGREEEDQEDSGDPNGGARPVSVRPLSSTQNKSAACGSFNLFDYKPFEGGLDAKPLLALRTANTTCAKLELPPGRHVLLMKVSNPFVCGLSIYSNREVSILSESAAIPLLVQPCAALQQTVVDAMQMLNALLGADVPKGATQQQHTDQLASAIQPKMASGLQSVDVLVHSLLWTLEHSLGDKYVPAAWIEMLQLVKVWVLRAFRFCSVSAPPLTINVIEDSASPSLDTTLVAAPLVETHEGDEDMLEGEEHHDSEDVEQAEGTGGCADDVRDEGEGSEGDEEAAPAPTFSEEEVNAAAMVITRAVRRYSGERSRRKLEESKVKTLREGISVAWQAVKANSLDFGVTVARRFFEECPEILDLMPFAREEKNVVFLQDAGGDAASLGAGFHVLLWQKLSFEQATHVRFHLQCDLKEEATLPASQRAAFSLSIFDHAQAHERSFIHGAPITSEFAAGCAYTLVVTACIPGMREAFPWRLRCQSLPQLPDMTVGVLPPKHEMFNGKMLTTEDRVLFRYEVTPSVAKQLVHFKLQLPAPDVFVHLELENKRKNFKLSRGGFGGVIIPNVLMDTESEEGELGYVLQACTRDALLGSAPASAVSDTRKRKGTAKSSGKKTSTGPTGWMLDVLSEEDFSLVVEAREEKRIKELLLGWEAAEPGRAEKAAATRQKYEEGVDTAVEHLMPSKPDLKAPVLDDERLTEEENAKVAQVRAFREHREVVSQQREAEKAERSQLKTEHVKQMAESRRAFEEAMTSLASMRNSVHAARAKVKQAHREQELASSKAAEEAEADKKTKGKGKKK